MAQFTARREEAAKNIFGPLDEPGQAAEDPIVAEAMRRWKRCAEWEATARERFLDDVKFAEGDPDNGFQWPAAMKRNRDVSNRPCLTLNITRQHNLQIRNEAKQNKASIKIRATGGGASVKSANLMEALVRQIEYRSNAQSAYAHAAKYQVDGGIGWFRLITQYVADDSFDQELIIKKVWDPLSVYIDPDAHEDDKSDANFGFVFDLVNKDKFHEAYPEFDGIQSMQPLGVGTSDDDFAGKNYVRICEYFRRVKIPDKLVSFMDPLSGLRKNLLVSKMPKGLYKDLKENKEKNLLKERDTSRMKVEWYLIVGQEVVDETEWAGEYIPLIPMLGEETIVDGIMDRKGHTRYMKDSQRMYNYNASAQVEFVALQSKTPYIASNKAIEEYESMWNTANTVNHSVLIYNAFDPDHPDKPLNPPVRQQPPTSAPGFQEGMETAFNQMMMTSGQWQNQMGMMGNERTGSAIKARQAQSDTSVYHYQDAYGEALRSCGRKIINLIPHIYDTQRLMRLNMEDGEEFDLEINPKAQNALQEIQNESGAVVVRVLNPSIGKYDVEADVGASYGTRRQETVEALTLVLTQAPALTGIIGDLLLRAMDFKEAREAAMRLKRLVPPQALGDGPTPQEQQLQERLAASQAALSKALQETAKKDLKLVGKDEMRNIDVYKAHTDRVKALADLIPDDPQLLQNLLGELDSDTLKETLRPILEANLKHLNEQSGGEPDASAESEAAEKPPMSGAQKAPDGEWYILDPTRKGKYLRIAPLAQQHSPR
jgi:hypothetical protein